MFIWLLLGSATESVPAQVFSSEFFSDPASEGWDLLGRYCEPQTWNAEGWYYQRLSLDACPPGPGGGDDAYQRSLQALNGTARFFLEFRLQTDGERSEIPYGAPTVVALANSYGVVYHVTIARDLIQLFRDVDLPILLIGIEPGVPHTYRIELYPDRYAFYIDAYLSDEGLPDGPFPARDSRIAWEGDSWYLPCDNAWDYIRYGVTPIDGSGDYNSNGTVTQNDFFFHECLTNVRPGINDGPDENAGPGCRFADFDSDGDTDLLDFAQFQNAFHSSP
ncbi:MAG: hypothetical protein HY287_08715 [Planctomycetes bacterium]|nr:hypothetical protein [Planctomycetota bacterium]